MRSFLLSTFLLSTIDAYYKFDSTLVFCEVIMKIYIDDGFLEYERLGNGIPLLLIHGYPLSRMIWLPQMVGLSDGA